MKYEAYRAVANLDYPATKVFEPSGAPVITADSLEDLELKVLVHLEKFPDDTILIMEADNGFLQEFYYSRYHWGEARAGKHSFVLGTLLLFCAASLFATAVGLSAVAATVAFIVTSAVYLGLIKIGLTNEIEGFIVVAIIFVMTLVVLPRISERAHAAREAARTAATTRLALP
jgi:hypothetical protein